MKLLLLLAAAAAGLVVSCDHRPNGETSHQADRDYSVVVFKLREPDMHPSKKELFDLRVFAADLMRLEKAMGPSVQELEKSGFGIMLSSRSSVSNAFEKQEIVSSNLGTLHGVDNVRLQLARQMGPVGYEVHAKLGDNSWIKPTTDNVVGAEASGAHLFETGVVVAWYSVQAGE